MDRKNVLALGVAFALGAAAVGLSQALAQRDFRTEPRHESARYQVVNVTDGEIILLDTTSGDLYSAKPRDVRPYSERPRPPRGNDREKIRDTDIGVKTDGKVERLKDEPFPEKDVRKTDDAPKF
jgi:hypothetical protein